PRWRQGSGERQGSAARRQEPLQLRRRAGGQPAADDLPALAERRGRRLLRSRAAGGEEESKVSGPAFNAAVEVPEGVRPFGKYYLIRKLAEGGMAEIFLAKQLGAEGFERNVVIKQMLNH